MIYTTPSKVESDIFFYTIYIYFISLLKEFCCCILDHSSSLSMTIQIIQFIPHSFVCRVWYNACEVIIWTVCSLCLTDITNICHLKQCLKATHMSATACVLRTRPISFLLYICSVHWNYLKKNTSIFIWETFSILCTIYNYDLCNSACLLQL